jgi:hypothetical protein
MWHNGQATVILSLVASLAAAAEDKSIIKDSEIRDTDQQEEIRVLTERERILPIRGGQGD